MQIFAIVVSLAITAVALVFTARAVRQMLAVIRRGQPAVGRSDRPAARTVTMLKETFLHTRMLQWTWVGALHWFVYAAFLGLSTAVAAAYFQLFNPEFAIPVIGHWIVYEWGAELIGLLGTLAIVPLIIYRLTHLPSAMGRKSRFFGSTMWQAYFVEAMVLIESVAILFIRGAEWKLFGHGERSHFPISSWIGDALYPDDRGTLETIVVVIAMIKIVSAMAWLIVIASNLTMGVAWHRFTAWFNIWFKRESSGRTALGSIKPLTSGGKAITLDDIDDLDEDSTLGAGTLEDFSWKGILDFTTCTECGRCQSQCPAWNTEKPLSPKLLVMGLREHAYAKAAGDEAHSERVLVGSGTKGADNGAGTDVLDYFYNPSEGDFVIDEDVLWSCTSCGACVQQCPVDIEHVDHIMDMRRYQILVESNFPAELNGLFKGLENKGNPWNMSPTARMDWAKGLDFDIPVVGDDLESLESVDWLFWVGCAGAYEDRAKKTTRAVAELLNIAGISFGVLGNGETCTGDPARRAGNEFVFQGLAQQNVETFKEFKVKKVVSTCAHCFNTLKNEYKEFGIELEVVHHTQLLNRLVREGKLTPVTEGPGAAKRSITYHDPCFLGRHNQVYEPPRELLQVLPGAEVVEMERNSEKSFCCGAGGARMWMEETLGERININRTKEAVGTGADQIAVGCPFCRVMLSDGLTAQQAAGEAREEVEVLDVAQMLLASVKGEQATKAAPGSAKKAAAAGATAGAAPAAGDVAVKDEPEVGDVTQTEDTVTKTSDVGPNAKASGGSSLFDTPAPEPAKPATTSGGSLFDTPAPEPAKSQPAKAEPEPAKPAAASGGSLFDLAAPEPEAKAKPEPAAAEPEAAAESAEEAAAPAAATSDKVTTPTTDLGAGGSLFDLAAPEPAKPKAEAQVAEPKVEAAAAEAEAAEADAGEEATEEAAAPTTATSAKATTPTTDLGAGGSLFDLPAPEPAKPTATPPVAPAASESSETSETRAEPEAPAAPPSGAELSQAATAAGSAEPEPADVAPAEDEQADAPAEDEAADENADEATDKPEVKPAGGAAHTPKTDADINSSGSLFDL